MSDGKVAFESSLRFGGFFANDLINKTTAIHIFSKADALLEKDFQMALGLGAFMDDFDGMALSILALDLVSVTKYTGCKMKCSLPSFDGTDPTILAFNTTETGHAATVESRTPILPSSTASDFDESSLCNGTSCVQLNLVNGCPYEIFVAGAVHVNLTAGTTKTKSVPAVSSAQRLWANTDCDKMNNPHCNLAAAMPPISLFEWTFDADGKQTFDVSYVDGANVPISVHVPNCTSVTYDNKLGNSLDKLVDGMPDAMKMVDSNGKKRVKSVCLAYGTDSVCCRNAHDQPTTCGRAHNWTADQIAGYNAMLAAFPTSYNYAYDDRNATKVCWSCTNFRIGFCTN
ncbi:hypothetical protein GPALN_006649 [Globodera pallida]|nr:hypothetical protein GPALN_006649 [Globodera pallida]